MQSQQICCLQHPKNNYGEPRISEHLQLSDTLRFVSCMHKLITNLDYSNSWLSERFVERYMCSFHLLMKWIRVFLVTNVGLVLVRTNLLAVCMGNPSLANIHNDKSKINFQSMPRISMKWELHTLLLLQCKVQSIIWNLQWTQKMGERVSLILRQENKESCLSLAFKVGPGGHSDAIAALPQLCFPSIPG